MLDRDQPVACAQYLQHCTKPICFAEPGSRGDAYSFVQLWLGNVYSLSDLPPPSALPSVTSVPTGTETPTQTVPTGTATPLPTVTNPPPTVASSGSVVIATVNKAIEYVDLQNVGNGPVDLSGWRLVSVTGNQSCPLRGVIGPNEVLRVWSGNGDSGLSCGFAFNIWNDNRADPAVLFDAQGREISRYP